MAKSPEPGSDRALRVQIKNLESQLMVRRQRMRLITSGIRNKFALKLTSPGMLLSAAGVGVALEQTHHHRGWSVVGLLTAVNSCLRLLISFSSMAPAPIAGSSDTTE